MLAYTRYSETIAQFNFYTGKKSRPKRFLWSDHSRERALERAGWSITQGNAWISSVEYLGRWGQLEGWGDEQFVILGLRKHGVLTISTFEPREYWDYDVDQYYAMMDRISGEKTLDEQ